MTFTHRSALQIFIRNILEPLVTSNSWTSTLSLFKQYHQQCRDITPLMGGGCKGTLLSTHFSNGISPPHDSGHIPSLQRLVCPTTSPVNCLLLIQLLPHLHLINPFNRNSEMHSKDLCTLFHCLSLLYLSPLLCYHHCSPFHCS